MDVPVTPGRADGGRDARRTVTVTPKMPRPPRHMLYRATVYVMMYAGWFERGQNG
jgi:hypothetical protein